MKERHHVAQQMLEEQQWQKDNGPIDITADQLWKYSGEIEKDSKHYIQLISEKKSYKRKLGNISRKEYFKAYWLKRKKKLKIKIN